MKRLIFLLAVLVFQTLGAATVTFNGGVTYQTIEGFGANINHRSWTNDDLKPVIDALVDQAGMTLFRVIYDKTDWEGTNENTSPYVMNWDYYNQVYSSAEFQKMWGLVAYLNQKGISNGVMFNFQGNGPAWLGVPALNTGMEPEWAQMVASLLIYARQTNQLQFGLVGPDNEMDETSQGVNMSASQYVTALHDLSQLLDTNGVSDLRFVGPDLAGGGTTYMPQMMADPVVMSKVAHFGVHSYSDGGGGSAGVYSYIQGSAYPDRTLWVTEFNVSCPPCDAGVLGTYDWTYCEGTAEYLMQHLLNNASAGMVWEGYDSQYNYFSPLEWSFWGLFGVDDTNAVDKTYTARKNFYTLAQISKFVRPGAQRIGVSGSSSSFSPLLAFNQPGLGQITIVGINTSGSAATLSGALASLPTVPYLELYYTSPTANLADGGSVAVSNGAFSATIPANCVFTLTGFTGVNVALTNPVNGAQFSAPATIPLAATATTTAGSLALVGFYTGATEFGEATNAPYEFTWNNVPMGDYSLTARATDTAGNSGTSAVVYVTVEPRLGHGHARDDTGDVEHGVGTVGLCGPQGDLHLGDRIGQSGIAAVHVSPAEEHGMDAHAERLGGFAHGGGIAGRRPPLGRFDPFESGGLPSLQQVFAGDADHRFVQFGLQRFCGSMSADRQTGAGRGRNRQELAASEMGSHDWFLLFKPCNARHGGRVIAILVAQDGGNGIEGIRRGGQSLLRVDRLLPRQNLPGVIDHAAEEPQHRALGHVVAVVDRLARTDCFEELHVLDVIGEGRTERTGPGAGHSPVRFAFDAEIENDGATLCADDDVVDVPGAAGDLAAIGVDVDAVRILVGDGVVIVDVALLGIAALTPTDAPGPHGRLLAESPGGFVEAVDVLLGIEIAGEPDEVLPVAQLMLHFGPLRLPRPIGKRGGQVGLLDALDFADGAVVDALHHLTDSAVIPPAEAGNEVQVLLFRLLDRGHDAADAGGVDGDRFFTEDLQARIHRGLQMRRAEVGRLGQDHHVDQAATDQLLGGVEAGEAVIGRDGDFGGSIFSKRSLNILQTVWYAVAKGVGHCHELAVLVGPERVDGGAAAAIAAANQPDLQQVAAGGMGAAGDRQAAGQSPGGRQGGCGLEEVTAGGPINTICAIGV